MSNLDRRPRGRFRGPRGGRGKFNPEHFESARTEEAGQSQEKAEAGGYKGSSWKNTDRNQQEQSSERGRFNNRRGRFGGNRRRANFRSYDQGGQRHYEEGKSEDKYESDPWSHEEKKGDYRNEKKVDDAYQQRSYREGERAEPERHYGRGQRNRPYQNRSHRGGQRGGQRDEHHEYHQERSQRGGQWNEHHDSHQERSYRSGERNEPERNQPYTERSYRGDEKNEPERSHRGERNEHYEPYHQRRSRGFRNRNRYNRGRPYTSPGRTQEKEVVEETSAPQEQERSSTARPRGDYHPRRGRYNNRRRGYRGGRFNRENRQPEANRETRQPEVHEEKPQPKVETAHPHPHYVPKQDPEPKKAAPQFTLINGLEPELRGFNVKCKAVNQPYQIQSSFRGKSISAWEVLVGDESGCIKLQLPNEEIAKAIKPNSSIFARNGIIIMRDHKFMVLLVNQWGKVEISSSNFEFQVNKNNNLSDVEYEIAN